MTLDIGGGLFALILVLIITSAMDSVRISEEGATFLLLLLFGWAAIAWLFPAMGIGWLGVWAGVAWMFVAYRLTSWMERKPPPRQLTPDDIANINETFELQALMAAHKPLPRKPRKPNKQTAQSV